LSGCAQYNPAFEIDEMNTASSLSQLRRNAMRGQFYDEAVLRRACPHCGTHFHRPLDPAVFEIGLDKKASVMRHAAQEVFLGITGDEIARLFAYICPKCGNRTIDLLVAPFQKGPVTCIQLRPLGTERPVAAEVPVEIADDYREATRIAGLSSRGAATLARRALQATLRRAFPEMPQGDLFDEIAWVEQQTSLETELASSLHSLRKAGNFGAHPPKDGSSVVYDLNPEDLEACFMILDLLFDSTFVKPARTAIKLAALKERMFPQRPAGERT
jgi:predicted RNA-binding Zn-ribbon protein involved in translation (DUF1610 family)